MKRYAHPIQVRTRGDRPETFRWRGREYRVLELLDQWRIRTRWWAQEGDRRYCQVLARRTDSDPRPEWIGVYELCQRGEQWRMERVLD